MAYIGVAIGFIWVAIVIFIMVICVITWIHEAIKFRDWFPEQSKKQLKMAFGIAIVAAASIMALVYFIVWSFANVFG